MRIHHYGYVTPVVQTTGAAFNDQPPTRFFDTVIPVEVESASRGFLSLQLGINAGYYYAFSIPHLTLTIV